MSDLASSVSRTTLQPFSNSQLPQLPSFRVRGKKVKSFSDLNDQDKESIIYEAARYLRDQERTDSGSRLSPPKINTYIGALTRDLIYKCDKNAIDSSSGVARSPGEENFLSGSVAKVQEQKEQLDNNESTAKQHQAKQEQEYDSTEPQPRIIPKPWITTFGKLVLWGSIALGIAYALLFWPDLNSYLQSPEVLNCAAGTIGQIAFGFCLLAAVLLAFAVFFKPKSMNEYKPLGEESETRLIAKQNQPSIGMRILAGVFFLACVAALVLFTGGIDGSKIPAVNEAISGISSLSALICSGIFVAALILPRVVRFLRAIFCPTCCNNDTTNGVLNDEQLANRDAILASYTHGEQGSAIPSVLRDLNGNEREESFQSRLGF